jgi:hypothetical protein
VIVRLTTFVFVATALSCVSSEQIRRDEYDANYQTAVKNCGNPQLTFQAGYNEGVSRRPMKSDWATMCRPDLQQITQTAYQDGFMAGAQNAPAVMVHQIQGLPRNGGPSLVAPDNRGNQCSFDSDCGGSGWHCRDHTCRGFGAIGETCQWNDECSSDHCFGGSCRE